MIKLIIGLGNPGKEYEKTRHNIGFILVDALTKKLDAGDWSHDKRFRSDITKAVIDGNKVLLAKPLTYMNKSGDAVKSIAEYYHIQSDEILVVADDLNLDLGKTRLRLGGSDGGHNGLKSIIESCGVDFWRLRIGIGYNDKIVAEDYVLERIPASDSSIIKETIDRAVDNLISSSIANPKEETAN